MAAHGAVRMHGIASGLEDRGDGRAGLIGGEADKHLPAGHHAQPILAARVQREAADDLGGASHAATFCS